MAFVQQNFSAIQTIGILLDGLAAGAYAESTMLNSVTPGAISAIIAFNFTLGVVGNVSDYVGVYMARSLDGITYDDVNNNLAALGSFNQLSLATQQFFTVNTAMLGTLPPYWKFIIYNGTSDAFGMGSGATLMWASLQDNT
jgi:hypothetical protein